ncbi:hypothetical protein ABE073_04325 [Lederbergia citrisecunda]|uniref:hypothetical protein n=1 Tax=Lederbergia citrisecunda TaxID=2833583 RepID=UPI003D29F9C9
MAFVVRLNNGSLENLFYAGRISFYTVEGVAVPTNTDDLDLAKKYKYRSGAENAVKKILAESTYVTDCSIEEI